MDLLDRIARIVGPANLMCGADMDRWTRDWTGNYP
jgi:hypothetical protein